jgi:DNA-binding winged helix-turn-helix (wHTH) protein/tetratricopeptide (TPR) repeat protein
MILDTEKYLLLADGDEIPVEPQVFNLIVFLVVNKNKIVTRDSILDEIWKGRVVSDTSINNHIKSARKVLGDDGIKQQVIKTIHSRGYQFVAATQVLSKTSDADSITKPIKPNKKTIAVLPFANNKPDKDSDYLGFALATQIISDLSFVDNFSLCPAGSIRKYCNQVIDPICVGEELKADYVLSGHYLKENKVIRLNIELIEVGTNRLIWRDSMQVDYSNTFELQDLVAQKVAKGLNVDLRQSFFIQKHKDIPANALAYEYYLRGISYPFSNEGHKLAVEMLVKSIELDANYAPAYTHLGNHRRLLEQHGRIVPIGLKSAEWYYKKALKLNPKLTVAMNDLAGLYTETNRIEDALELTRKMLELKPNNAETHFSLGYIYRYAGMLDEAIQEMETALMISPDNARFRSIISTYVSAGKYKEALAKIYLDAGDYGIGYSGIIAFNQNNMVLAFTLFNKVTTIDTNGIWGLIAQFHMAIINDDKPLALTILTKMVNTNIVDAENFYYFSSFYALLGEKQACLNMLDKAVNTGYFNYPHISQSNAFTFIKNDPQFIEIVKRAKKRHDAFRKKYFSL